jgi:hypothetical protein
MAGQTTFLILSPSTENMTIGLGGVKTLVISTSGGDRINAPYVQSLKVNGEPWDKSWATWEVIFCRGRYPGLRPWSKQDRVVDRWLTAKSSVRRDTICSAIAGQAQGCT